MEQAVRLGALGDVRRAEHAHGVARVDEALPMQLDDGAAHPGPRVRRLAVDLLRVRLRAGARLRVRVRVRVRDRVRVRVSVWLCAATSALSK